MAAFKFLSSCWCPQMCLCKGASESSDLLVCLCACVCEREKDRDWEGKQERKNVSEFVLLRHHTLRPKESMPEAVWEEDFILHIVEAIQVIGCVCLCVYACQGQVVLVSICMHTSVPSFHKPKFFTLTLWTSQHFVINTYRQCEKDKNRQKRQTVCLDSKPLFCIVTSGAYMNTKAFSSLKANKKTNDWLDSFIET